MSERFSLGVGEWEVDPITDGAIPFGAGRLHHPGVPTAKSWKEILRENMNFQPAPRTCRALIRNDIFLLLRDIEDPREQETLRTVTHLLEERPPSASTLFVKSDVVRDAIVASTEEMRSLCHRLDIAMPDRHVRIDVQMDAFVAQAMSTPGRPYVPTVVQLGEAIHHACFVSQNAANDPILDRLVELYRRVGGVWEWQPEQPQVVFALEPQISHCRRSPNHPHEWKEFGQWHVDLEGLHFFFGEGGGILRDAIVAAPDDD